jgi:hypothetical protein
LRLGRHIGTRDKAVHPAHCEVCFDELFVPASAVFGMVESGFEYAQVRRGPARTTHVTRGPGAARRGHDEAAPHLARRKGFDARIGDLGTVQKVLADNEIDIASTPPLLTRAGWELDQGGRASTATSIVKTNAVEAIVPGVSENLPPARATREVCRFRTYGGHSHVHRWSIAKRVIGAAKRAPREQK